MSGIIGPDMVGDAPPDDPVYEICAEEFWQEHGREPTDEELEHAVEEYRDHPDFNPRIG